MTKLLVIFVLTFASAYANDSSRVYKNMVGWDDGIAYRRMLSPDYFIGISLLGGLNKSEAKTPRILHLKPAEISMNQTTSDAIFTEPISRLLCTFSAITGFRNSI